MVGTGREAGRAWGILRWVGKPGRWLLLLLLEAAYVVVEAGRDKTTDLIERVCTAGRVGKKVRILLLYLLRV